MPGAGAAIELALDPAAGAAEPLLGVDGCRPAGRAVAETLVWHDTEAGALAAEGLALLSSGGTWSLERLHAGWAAVPPVAPERVTRRELLGAAVPAMAVPAATWCGTRQPLRWSGPEGEVEATLWLGAVGGAPLGRVCAGGTPAALRAFAAGVAGTGAGCVATASFGAAALGLAGRKVATRAPDGPELRPGDTVGEAAAAILGHLADTMLRGAACIPAATGPEPVHQMRVATRRLRSALSMFGGVLPGLDGLRGPARACAARLGRARDWDVFVAGAGAELVASFPGDKRCAALVRAAGRARLAAYAELRGYLAGTAFRVGAVELACAAGLRPWGDAEGAGQPIEAFAAATLARRYQQVCRPVRRAEGGIEGMPAAALHELRKRCKRLRYSVDFLAGPFPARHVARMQRRLAALQEELGLLNDADTAPRLLAGLGRLERGYAAGLVVGMAAGRAQAARPRIGAAWRRFRAADCFWTG